MTEIKCPECGSEDVKSLGMVSMVFSNMWIEDNDLHRETHRDPNFVYGTDEWWCGDCDYKGTARDFGVDYQTIKLRQFLSEQVDDDVGRALKRGWKPTFRDAMSWYFEDMHMDAGRYHDLLITLEKLLTLPQKLELYKEFVGYDAERYLRGTEGQLSRTKNPNVKMALDKGWNPYVTELWDLFIAALPNKDEGLPHPHEEIKKWSDEELLRHIVAPGWDTLLENLAVGWMDDHNIEYDFIA